MKKWFEVFRTGTHTSANGTTRNWTEKDLDKMVSSYDAGTKPAPLVVGHPKTNDPAYGWTKKLRRVGTVLMALPEKVEEQFSAMVKDGRFPKRSISVYPDGSLRHIGFLGAQPPAIKGLKDVDFADDLEAETYEYAEQEAQMPTVEELQKKLEEETKARKEAEKAAKTNKEKAEKSEADFVEHRAKSRKQDLSNFVDAGIKEGKILPAWKESGIVDFMDGLEGQEETFEFAEGKKETRAEWFKGFIESFSAHPLFKEMVPPDGDDKEKQEDSEFAADEKEAESMAAPYRADD